MTTQEQRQYGQSIAAMSALSELTHRGWTSDFTSIRVWGKRKDGRTFPRVRWNVEMEKATRTGVELVSLLGRIDEPFPAVLLRAAGQAQEVEEKQGAAQEALGQARAIARYGRKNGRDLARTEQHWLGDVGVGEVGE